MVVVQRVAEASVYANSRLSGRIGRGLLLYVAIDRSDLDQKGQLCNANIQTMAHKIPSMRLFSEAKEQSHFISSLRDIKGQVLCVSQFTLPGRTNKGTRPSFERAAPAEQAEQGYNTFCDLLAAQDIVVQRGVFGADMRVHSINDGPVTLLLGSKEAETPWL